jgi:hypothetical protein
MDVQPVKFPLKWTTQFGRRKGVPIDWLAAWLSAESSESGENICIFIFNLVGLDQIGVLIMMRVRQRRAKRSNLVELKMTTALARNLLYFSGGTNDG